MADELGDTAQDRPFDGDWVRQRRTGNWAIFAALVALCALFFMVTVIKLGQGSEKKAAEQGRDRAVEALARSEGMHPSDLKLPEPETADD